MERIRCPGGPSRPGLLSWRPDLVCPLPLLLIKQDPVGAMSGKVCNAAIALDFSSIHSIVLDSPQFMANLSDVSKAPSLQTPSRSCLVCGYSAG